MTSPTDQMIRQTYTKVGMVAAASMVLGRIDAIVADAKLIQCDEVRQMMTELAADIATAPIEIGGSL